MQRLFLDLRATHNPHEPTTCVGPTANRFVFGGFGHGAMSLYARDGELMATASQSLIVRVRESAGDR